MLLMLLMMMLMKVINAIILPIANNWPSVKRSIDNDNLKRPGRYCPDGSQWFRSVGGDCVLIKLQPAKLCPGKIDIIFTPRPSYHPSYCCYAGRLTICKNWWKLQLFAANLVDSCSISWQITNYKLINWQLFHCCHFWHTDLVAKLKHYHRRGQNIHPCQCSNKLRPYMAASKGYYLKTQSSLKVHFTFKAAISCLVAGMPVYIILNLVFDTCSVHYMTVQQCKEKIQRRLSAIVWSNNGTFKVLAH